MTVERKWPEGVAVREVPQFSGKLYAQVTRGTSSGAIHVSGCLPFGPDNELVGEGDMAAQVRCVLENIRISLAAFGATTADVLRTKTYVVDMQAYLISGHAEYLTFFGEDLPASTLVAVAGLTEPRALVEIEAYAESPVG